MIVRAHTVTLIVQEKVTCLILPASEGRRYRVGESYPVQPWKPREGGGAPVVSGEKLRVKVTDRCALELGQVTPETAASAGFEDLDALYGFWRQRYNTGPLADPEVVVIGLEVDRLERDRYLRPGGGYTTSPRLALGATSHHGSDLRSVDTAAQDVSDRPPRGREPEPAAVSTDEQRALTRRAKEVWNETASMRRSIRERDQRRREQGVRLEEAKRKARRLGVNVDTDVRVIEDRLQRMERKVDDESNGDAEAA